MALSLYLDDCANSDLLANLLRQAGHRVVRPTDDGVGLGGEDDDIHLDFAAANGLTLITKNPADFKALHDLDPRHSGILAVYQDNDPSGAMGNAEIVRAIRNLEQAVQQAGFPIQGKFPHSTIGATEGVRWEPVVPALCQEGCSGFFWGSGFTLRFPRFPRSQALLGNAVGEALLPVRRGSLTRSRASQPCVPKQSLGTRGTRKRDTAGPL